jgi:hypothetical protein
MAYRLNTRTKSGSIIATKTGGSGSVPPQTAKKPTPRRPSLSAPPMGNNGIVVCIGPASDDNRIIREWFTLPLTPESLPVAASGNWQDGRYAILGGETSRFVGANLDTVSFSGVLEPPAFYEPANVAQRIGGLDFGSPYPEGAGIGDLVTQITATVTLTPGVKTNVSVQSTQGWRGSGIVFINQVRCTYDGITATAFSGVQPTSLGTPVTFGVTGTPIYATTPRDLSPDGQIDPLAAFADSQAVSTRNLYSRMGIPYYSGGTGVVMQVGAHAGPEEYFEPHEMGEMLYEACRHGEVVRLIMGDHWGYNDEVAIREFAWRFEDPDPDTLYFNISFREYREPASLVPGAKQMKKGKRNKPTHYVTRYGDRLADICVKFHFDPHAWTKIVTLNRRKLELLYRYPTGYPQGKNNTQTFGDRITGRSDGSQLKKLTHVTDWDPFWRFRDGVNLVLAGDIAIKTGGSGWVPGQDRVSDPGGTGWFVQE